MRSDKPTFYWDEDASLMQRYQMRSYLLMRDKAGMQVKTVPEYVDVYRLYLDGASGATVVYFGIGAVDEDIEGYYDDVNHLPIWMQERLALLLMISPVPPISEVEGIGQRIDEKVFWVYKPVL